MASQTILKAKGLATQPNELNVEEGSLLQASNVIIKNDNTIESRRGYKLYGDTFGSASSVAKQLMEYKQRILRHYASTLQYDTEILDEDGNSIFSNFSGSYSEVQSGLRIKSIESNGNLYFTTNDGIKRISASSASEFTTSPGFIQNAGGIKALNINTSLDITQGSSTGFLPQDSAVAYRVVWGLTDANNDEILGTPSQRSVVYFSLQTQLIRDFNQLLFALDNLAVSGDSYLGTGTYVNTYKLVASSSASDIYNALISLATALDQDPGNIFASGLISSATISSGLCTVTFGGGVTAKITSYLSVGDKVYLDGFSVGTSGSINGVQTITAIDNGAKTIQFTTTAVGTVTYATESIQRGKFRALSAPTTPVSPVTDAQLVSLQDCLDSIILALQLPDNQKLEANVTGTGTNYSISSAAIAAGTLTITFNSAANTNFQTGQFIYLEGFTPASGSLDGHFTITGVSGNAITVTTSASGAVTFTNGLVSKIIWFGNDLQTEYIFPLAITTTANVDVEIVIPAEVTVNDFYQIYRSSIISATGTDVLVDLSPNDEMRLVYESFPTQADIDSGSLIVEDITPDSFVQGSSYLYTNENNGEGILQANDIPPLATDVNKFKNVIFYSNTKTREKLNLSLLGLSKIFADHTNGLVPTFSVVGSNAYNEYRFIPGVNQVVTITCNTTLVSSGPSTYFTINNANNKKTYYVWYQNGTSTDPAVAGATGVRIDASSLGTATAVARKTRDVLAQLIDDFSTSSSTSTVTVTYVSEGAADIPSVGTSSFTTAISVAGKGERIAKNITSITCVAGSSLTSSGTADYFTLNTPFDRQNYYFWYQVGTSTNPSLSGRTGVQITALNSDTASQVATKTATAISNLTGIYSASALSTVVTATTHDVGYTVPATEHVTNAGFLVSTTQAGATDVLLSSIASPSLAVQETTLSLINVINNNSAEIVSAYYLSGATDVPGLFILEANNLSTTEFFVQVNADGTGASFQPNLAPTYTSLAASAANPTIITEATHGYSNTTQILITGSSRFDGSGVFPSINGIYTIDSATTNTFSIPKNVITSGSIGALTKTSLVNVSTDENKPNRIYYSKYLQPDAVPIVNTIDVGATDKAILRIFPLRDSLFVFKEDGLYRISGETAPFNLTLFDSSCVLLAPDSVSVSNNVVYAWTTKGICQVTEFGVAPISRPIDVDIFPLATSQYVNFTTATWGVGYESDNSYTVWTVSDVDDVVATQAYRYSNLTQTWTTFAKTNTCGIRFSVDDRLYLGAGDTNSIEQERKNFNRTDYADREYKVNLNTDSYLNDGLSLKLDTVTNTAVGDVLLQLQYVTPFTFNGLLQKLDLDPGLSPALTVTNASWSSGTVTITCSASIPSYISIGQSVLISGLVPLEYNGIVTITGISGAQLTFSLAANPGVYQNNGGTLKFSYLGTFEVVPTNSLRDKLVALCAQLDIDPGITSPIFSSEIAFNLQNSVTDAAGTPAVITSVNHGLQTGRIVNITFSTTSPNINGLYSVTRIDADTFSLPTTVISSGTCTFETEINNFRDIQTCFNLTISSLNSDATTGFKNYKQVTSSSSIECIITSVNKLTKVVGVSHALPFVFGPVTVYKAISCLIEYVPVTANDALNMKQFRDSTIIFHDQTFTTAQISFGSDLLPEYIDVPINGSGNGLFGLNNFGSGFFGGKGNSAPFRTYIPRNCQRCRFLKLKFTHNTAREKWSILGITVSGRVIDSARAYR